MKRILSTVVCLLSLGFSTQLHAQETVDIGIIKNEQITVVQKLLYPKTARTELGLHLGWMPFDAYLTTPNIQVSYDIHRSESFSFGGVIGGGYGLKSSTYRELESPTYGVAVNAYRYLGSVLAGVQYSPIYAKMNVESKGILHHDVYGALRGGVTVEQSVIPSGGLAFAPTISLGLGARIFLNANSALRIEVRDDFLLEARSLTESLHLKQNANLSIGYTMLSALGRKR
jgi:outer membrane beta-barrel protein